jgi:hypothetical protein
MPIANPRNGFVPQVNDLVKIVGACHPHLLYKIARVVAVKDDGHSIHFCEGLTFTSGELVYTGGDNGGLQFVASEQDIRDRAYALWEKDEIKKSPEQYWNDAVWQLSTDRWNVESGELKVECEGALDEVIYSVVQYATKYNIFLGDEIRLTDPENRSLTVATFPILKKLGLVRNQS